MNHGKGVLAGIRVVELAGVLAGPSVGMFLAELGAEVLKIEPPGRGDVTRSWLAPNERPVVEGVSAYFSSINWGKKTCTVDLKNGEDKTQFLALVDLADILLTSFKPGAAARLNIDYLTLHKRNARLIYGSIVGYNSEDNRAGYDAIIQAESGFYSMNGEAGSKGHKMPVALIDVLAGHQLKEGILAALLHRERTGEGRLVEVSLYETALASLVNQATNYLMAGHLPQPEGNEHPNIVPYGSQFVTADGKRIVLAVGTDDQFKALLSILEIEAKEIWKTNVSRVEDKAAVLGSLTQAIQKMDSVLFLGSLHKANIPAGEIKNLAEVFSTPSHLQVSGGEGKSAKGVRSAVFVPESEFIDLAPPGANSQLSLQQALAYWQSVRS